MFKFESAHDLCSGIMIALIDFHCIESCYTFCLKLEQLAEFGQSMYSRGLNLPGFFR